MQKIVMYLWFDSQAEATATFYTSIFKNSNCGINFPKAGSPGSAVD